MCDEHYLLVHNAYVVATPTLYSRVDIVLNSEQVVYHGLVGELM